MYLFFYLIASYMKLKLYKIEKVIMDIFQSLAWIGIKFLNMATMRNVEVMLG
jgi:hypothetical protein